MDFTGKNVLITGSSRGIGAATALAFAQHGATVALHCHRNLEKGREVIASLPGSGHLLLQADISDAKAVETLFDDLQSAFERLDIVVNNAGIFDPHPIDEVDYQHWQQSWKKTLDTNLVGAGNVCYWAAQQMIKQNEGRIINVTSRGAFRGEPEFPAYGASKAGLNALSQSLAKKLGKYNIGVYAVAPGFVATDMAQPTLDGPNGPQIKGESPLGRVALPSEVAHAILFYASEKALFMTGGIIDVNGASYLRS